MYRGFPPVAHSDQNRDTHKIAGVERIIPYRHANSLPTRCREIEEITFRYKVVSIISD